MIDALNVSVVIRTPVSSGILLQPNVLNTDIDSNSLVNASLIRVVFDGIVVARKVLISNVSDVPEVVISNGIGLDIVLQSSLPGYGIGPYGEGIF